jgi:hypothetical protein
MMLRTYQIMTRDPNLGGGWNLALFEDEQPAGGGIFPLPQEDSSAGMTWWNSMTEDARAHWLMMGASAVPAAARHAFRLAEAYEKAQAEGDEWVNIET